MTDNAFEVEAQSRENIGSSHNRRLRKQELIPAVIYGAGQDPQNIMVQRRKIRKAMENEAFFSHILTISIDGKKQQAVLKNVQQNPETSRILHIDFLRITAKEKITMTVPIHYKGGDVAPGVKLGGGILSHNTVEVEVRCLPADLPEYLEIDISDLEVEQSKHLSDIPLPKGVELVALAQGTEHDQAITGIVLPRAAVAEDSEADGADSEAASTEAKSEEDKASE